MSKVFVFGLDGATFDLILPWIEEGDLPNFAKLIADGTWCPLESVASMRSPAAWTTFMTGKNPGKHGLYEFYEPIPGTYDVRFVNGGMRRTESLWSLLTRQERKVGAVNVPMTYPAEEVNGVMLSGLDAPGPHSRGFSHPPELIAEIEQKFGPYILEPGVTGCLVAGRPDQAVTRLHEELVQKEEVTRYLMQRGDWDVFTVVFRSLDAVQHCFWKYMDPEHPLHDPEEAKKYGSVIRDAYRQLDKSLGAIRAELDDETTLMVMSDHGFGRKHPANTQLNRWLASRGWLEFASSGGSSKGLLTRALGSTYRQIVGRLPRRVKEKLADMLPALRNRVQSRLIYSGIDWEQTAAFSDSLFAAIRINMLGREPLGVVEPGPVYDEFVRDLKAALLEIRDAKSGEKIVAAVHHRDDIYTGDAVDAAPDLLIEWREDTVISGIELPAEYADAGESEGPMIPGEDPRIISGDHLRYGVFLMAGPQVKAGHRLEQAHLSDLTPTILALQGLPVPQDMDGTVLTDAFTTPPDVRQGDETATPQAPTGDATADYSDEERAAVHERLRDLGYVE
ncbi:Type I phosphodiesterase / nucleotide pyrophosphatase [Maioricimonas rarisocia]|uniref:Type I phosphodiesterase / nucleotide pyrophosphatase n=1 Tax=Maioricimonas rarisocia TaxID=2528026 RepID=A0A517ZDG9_9PLAN|nr:alkaline phosphatase family protein [Maioricimonas rarisocia]QDU40508.1 Type I phosphodiesterase / nucleotide pyrophosphatase [Maioricimonas rarisocia]